jgi:triphosphoribosyl-dephospho-CoA synthase
MDAGTFVRSLFALRQYFPAIAEAGGRSAPFAELRRLGEQAEIRMLAATKGINTHRGAIFCLGLLAAAANWRAVRGLPLIGSQIADQLAILWGEQLAAVEHRSSHGAQAACLYGVRGARLEAAAGFPILTRVALPVLTSFTTDSDAALIQTLFAVMAELDDTNLLHRGGPDGLALVQRHARGFLQAGGVHHPDWRRRAEALHLLCCARGLSPGGAADMLAAAVFLRSLSR